MAQVEWEEDGWLTTQMGKERLDAGDEFGCSGIPGVSWNDPGAVGLECREYLRERIDASKWAENPLSISTPITLTNAQHQILSNQGWKVHGVENDLMQSVWHNATDLPEFNEDWYNLGERGGSLEQGISDISKLEDEIAKGGLINLYWVGKINDVTIRHDSEIVDLLENSPVWFTTWGEAWSYWSVDRCNSFNRSMDGKVLNFVFNETIACNSAEPDAWDIPITWIIDVNGTAVESVSGVGEISENQRNTQEGWRLSEDGTILVSLRKGNGVSITLENETDYDIIGRTQFFNGFETAITITGHETEDLFNWFRRFEGNDELRFTWLVTPREIDDAWGWLPFAGVLVVVCSVAGIYLVLRSDAHHPSRSRSLDALAKEGEE